jgi:putative oxidoreductase
MEKYIFQIVRVGTAIILFQTLFFKFSGAEESVMIFSTLGIEPWGRYVTGIIELIASIFLMVPRLTWLGAAITFLAMIGAILSHVLFLGIVVQNDSGLLFGLALSVIFSSSYLLYHERKMIKIPSLKN